MKISYDKDKNRYYDVNDVEIHEGDIVKNVNGFEEQEVMMSADGCLGTDATNPEWIKR